MALKVTMPPGIKVRAYSAGQLNRFTGGMGGFLGYNRSIAAELRWTLRTMRHHSRVLYQNNDYAKKFVRLLVKNIPGPKGIRLQNKAKFPGGGLDTTANKIIETGFQRWGKRGICDVTGRLSWLQAQWLYISTIAVDGECFVRKVRGYRGNEFRFALQFIEADHIDENLNRTNLPGGNEIRMGIEYDPWGKAVAYHVLVKHPGDYTYSLSGNHYEVIPAADMIHGFLTERSLQGRGVPWMHTAVTRLHNLGGYEEAAVISKRTSASKMGFIVPPADQNETYEGDEEDDEENIVTEVEPGLLELLPPGYDFKQFAPAEPGGDYEPFMKRTLKGIASGLDVAYHKLASDLEGISYSSARAGELDDRDTWRIFQAFAAETLNDGVFPDWLEIQLLNGKTLLNSNGKTLPYSKIDQFNAAAWMPRGWEWTDPLKDGIANINELNHGLTTRARIKAEQGEDYADLVEEMVEEKKLIEGKQFSVETNFNGGSKNAGSKNP